MFEILIYVICAILAISGVVLTVVALPGVWLVYISVFILALVGKFTVITPTILITLFLLTLLSTFVDNILVALGAKRLGGSKWGMIGAILGVIVGVIVGNILGMLIGSILGATVFELLFAKKDFNTSLKAGLGSFLGILVSIVFKVGFSVGMIVYILIKVI